MSKIAVVGGGAAGLMAAYKAAENGHKVTLFEHNEKLGKKIYITGKGRCNVTNACDTEDLFNNFTRNPRFMYSAIYGFDNMALMDFLKSYGLELKTERGNRVYPASDHASDVTKTLEKAIHSKGVNVRLHTDVTGIVVNDGAAVGITYGRDDKVFECDAVIMATGGISYPTTGSDGSGFEMAKAVGHKVTDLRGSLIGLLTKEAYIPAMQGLALKNVTLTVKDGKKTLYSEFGEMLFTHQGISGPIVLTASSKLSDKHLSKELSFEIDLKPALSAEELDARITRDFNENINKQFKNSINGLLPSKMVPVVIELSGIDPEKAVNSITRAERAALGNLIKHFPGTITGIGDVKEAIVTRGGISVKEVNPSTMESKLVKNLYFCGEMLDVDAVTGGFNLQIAWSTGHLAGDSVE